MTRYPISFVVGGQEFKVDNVRYHRNGVCGEGFHVVLFHQKRHDDRFVGVVFEGKGQCAVFETTGLLEGDIDVGSNSWRGDLFEHGLREAVSFHETLMGVRQND